MKYKTCTKCQKKFPIEEFRWDNKAKGYRKSRCGLCTNARQREDTALHGEKRRALGRARYAQNSERVYRQNIKRRYNLTDEQVDYICNSAQCEICGAFGIERKLVVDHCHGTNKNRGILCHNCNAGLGQFKESPELLRYAIEYIQREDAGIFASSLEH